MESKPAPLHMKLLGILLALAGIVTVLGVAGLVWIDRWFSKQSDPVLAGLRKDVTDDIDFFCEQQALLAADPWFHEPRTEGDAGLLLNAWVEWDTGPAMPKRSPLAIPARLPQRTTDFEDWLTSQVDVSGLDFHWMEQLHAYDRWDLVKNTPFKPSDPFNLATAPIPDFVQMKLWARFRLLQGIKSGQPLAAARDVRQLAWLFFRTDSLLGGAIAAALLDTEREAHASLSSPPPEWQPMRREQIERLRVVLMSSFVFSNILMPVEVAKKARRCGEPISRCIALTESAFSAKMVESLARDRYSEAYSAFEQDLAAFPCPTSLGRLTWEHGATFERGAETVLSVEYNWMHRLPRSVFGPRVAERLISDNSSNLDRLHAFRKTLASGDFDSKP